MPALLWTCTKPGRLHQLLRMGARPQGVIRLQASEQTMAPCLLSSS